MSKNHWFHRNALKATTIHNFDLKYVASNSVTKKICSDTKLARKNLLDLLSDPNNTKAALDSAIEVYLQIFLGFIISPDPEDKEGDSKLRDMLTFKWTNSLLGQEATIELDSRFELCSMLLNAAIWYTKHAAKVAGNKDVITDEEAKEVHICLRKAAGIFQYVQQKENGRLNLDPESASDLDNRVLTAYFQQCVAEAQEVTVYRAISLKHSTGIISSLSYETSKLFDAAANSLSTLPEKVVKKWKKYLELKKAFYLSHAYSYHGDSLLSQDKCGEGLRCVQEAVKYFDASALLCKEYGAAEGRGTAKPDQYKFFMNLGSYVKRTLEKCERENGMIYHQPVPDAPPSLVLKATHGLAAPEEFLMPSFSPLWSKDSYLAFDMSKSLPPELRKEERKGKDGKPVPEKLDPPKERDMETTRKDASCVIS